MRNAKLLLEGGNKEPLKASSWHLTPQALRPASLTACGWAPGATGAQEQPLHGQQLELQKVQLSHPEGPFQARHTDAEMINQRLKGEEPRAE